MLDISDFEGDKKNKIYTIPVLFGKDFAFLIATLNILYGVSTIVYDMSTRYYYLAPVSLLLSFFPSFNNLIKTKTNNYSKESINKLSKELNSPLYFFLLIVVYCSAYT